MTRVKSKSKSSSKRARKKTFAKVVTRSELVSRDTVANHISGKCECEHRSEFHYSQFQDATVKRCNARLADKSRCKCTDFSAQSSFSRAESTKSEQDKRALAHKRAFMKSTNCASNAYRYSDRARSTTY